MPRTTLDIDAVVLRKLKEIQRREHKTLGQVASELLARVIGSETADEELPGAHVVALMHEHGVGTIWSRNRDFRKFDGITAVDPFDERFSAGFDA